MGMKCGVLGLQHDRHEFIFNYLYDFFGGRAAVQECLNWLFGVVGMFRAPEKDMNDIFGWVEVGMASLEEEQEFQSFRVFLC